REHHDHPVLTVVAAPRSACPAHCCSNRAVALLVSVTPIRKNTALIASCVLLRCTLTCTRMPVSLPLSVKQTLPSEFVRYAELLWYTPAGDPLTSATHTCDDVSAPFDRLTTTDWTSWAQLSVPSVPQPLLHWVSGIVAP